LSRIIVHFPLGGRCAGRKTVSIQVLRKGQKRSVPITVQRLVEDEKVASVDSRHQQSRRSETACDRQSRYDFGSVSPDSRQRFRLDPKVKASWSLKSMPTARPVEEHQTRRCHHRSGSAESNFAR
jgi:hypothetical protein